MKLNHQLYPNNIIGDDKSNFNEMHRISFADMVSDFYLFSGSIYIAAYKK